MPNVVRLSVSNTTRAPRPGEENGVHYNFVTVPEMEAMIQNNEFIEYAKVHSITMVRPFRLWSVKSRVKFVY